ncbi:ermin [Neopelma chrysocephalum]|uniref:ermin n=1 Tax=Neopelma chrysocephalum TaxID=114329 RepID=UPI000FCCF064|nr:ermin [Neopelma chrysocephalum]
MTEEVPAAAPTMPACNGSVPPGDGPLQGIGVIDQTPKSAGTVPCASVETGSDAPPAKDALEENRNSSAEDITPGDSAGEEPCQEKPEEKDGTLQQGAADIQDIQDTGTDGQGSGEGPGGTEGLPVGTGEPPVPAASPSGEAEESPAARADPRGDAAEEDAEDAEEEEDTEEDEVQVIEMKKEDREAPRLQQRDSCKEPPAPAGPACNSPLEKPGEQPSLGKKNDISRHSYSRYNTISYRRIRKGNTKQRIDEFESMMHL